jgi:hypothetical protein
LEAGKINFAASGRGVIDPASLLHLQHSFCSRSHSVLRPPVESASAVASHPTSQHFSMVSIARVDRNGDADCLEKLQISAFAGPAQGHLVVQRRSKSMA